MLVPNLYFRRGLLPVTRVTVEVPGKHPGTAEISPLEGCYGGEPCASPAESPARALREPCASLAPHYNALWRSLKASRLLTVQMSFAHSFSSVCARRARAPPQSCQKDI